MASPTIRASGSRRATKACARCRKRKIRCDFCFPTCGSCSLANADCQGFDSLQRIERPRSTIAHLENRVAQLEIELARMRSEQTADTLEVQYGSIERMTRRLAEAHAQPGHYRHTAKEEVSLLSLTSPAFLSQSPLPPFNHDRNESIQGRTVTENPPKSTTISSIPRHVIDIMLKNYCDIYRPQYPCLEESDLYSSCNRIFDDVEPSHFDFFSIAMTLAISANTLIRHDEKRAITAAEEFWATAAEHLQQVGHANPWQRVQALQLLAHYGLLNPKLVNCYNCAAAATRLCFQLGLHRELPASEQAKLSPTALNTRRRLFWTSYNIDAALHTMLFLPFAWPKSAITINFPEFGAERSPTAQVWAIRRIEAEITANMYYPTVAHNSAVADETFHDWYDDAHQRLEEWHESFKSHQTMDLANKIEFYEIMYQAQVFRLNRSSPRYPHPTLGMRRKAINAAIALIREYDLMQRLGKFFYIWHGTHYLVEYGASLLELILSGLEHSGQTETHLDGLDVTILSRTITFVPQLLRKVSRRWPDIQRYASAIEEITLPVHHKLDEWARGHSGNVSDDMPTQQIRRKLNRFLLFSTPSITDAPAIANLEGTSRNNNFDILLAAAQGYTATHDPSLIHQDMMRNTEYMLPQPTCLQMAPSQSDTTPLISSLDTSLTPSQQLSQAYDQSDLYADPGSMGSGASDGFYWNMAGLNSEEIFAAFLEGRDVLPS